MVNSLGPSWSFTGPFLKNALGGGSGAGGFDHLIRHVGFGMQSWLKDMATNSYQYTDDNLKTLGASVEEMLVGVDTDKLDDERNTLMLDLSKLRI